MKKLYTHIWLDKGQEKTAADFYKNIFATEIYGTDLLKDTPSGDVGLIRLRIEDQDFLLLGAGPEFKPNPSISFMVSCASEEEIDMHWKKLSEGGKVMMELDKYTFATKYGWIEDKFGISWQLSFMEGQPAGQKITPSIMYTHANVGKAKEAMEFYTSVFPESGIDFTNKYGESAGAGPNKPDYLNFATFHILGQSFNTMDSADDHKFDFTEGISIVVNCKDQAEIDMYWEKLSAVPESEQCGWLKDKYGISWQIVPEEMDKMLDQGDDAAKKRVTEAFLKMKKFNIAELKKAFEGK
jgi:predicted 3-demethylubiquinone-9 3-methyltransferase (glyoxalase superfamily)